MEGKKWRKRQDGGNKKGETSQRGKNNKIEKQGGGDKMEETEWRKQARGNKMEEETKLKNKIEETNTSK